jgi:Peptidase A4 family
MKDENWLKSQFAFPLVPTNVDGVYTTPPPPGDLDLKAASDATLWQHGLLLQRPTSGDHPAIVAAWDQVSEQGLRTIAPQLGQLLDAISRGKRRPGLGHGRGAQATSPNWCGCVLEGSGNWRSVVGTLSLPYLRVPSQGLHGNQAAALSAWVGLDGWNNSPTTLLQTIMNFALDTTTNPPSTFFATPTWQWWVPDPSDSFASQMFGGGTVTNAPAMKPGDLVQLYCGYVTARDGSNWGAVYFLFYNDPGPIIVTHHGPPTRNDHLPTLLNFFFPGPSGVPVQGASIEWIMENESATNTPTVPATMPVFSASSNAITPVTFTKASGNGQSQSVTGDLVNGFTVLWANNSGQPSNLASVTLAPDKVSIAYTGP